MSLPPSRVIDLPTGSATFLTDGPSDARTVLLLHGGGLDCASLSWRCLMPVLAAQYRVIAPNWPGYDGTAPFPGAYRIPDLGRWLMGFLDALEIERATLVGVSMGGGAALWSAIHHPARVEALVPVATYGVADRGPSHLLSFLLTRLPLNAIAYAVLRRSRWAQRRALQAIFADPGKLTDALVAELGAVLAHAGRGDPFTQFQRGEMTATGLRTVLTDELPRITQPTLFIHGNADSLVPVAAVERAAGAMPRARLEIMQAGHWPMRECPEAFNALVTDFLATLPATATPS
ncbi:MAG: alpha/beta hydrolase [Pseudomonadota bacterium]